MYYNRLYMGKVYAAIDLKSFYASVECAERNLDPLDTNLVVADESRTDKTICLAISPSLKAYGLPGRARLFEVIQKVREINYQRQQRAPQQKLTGKSASAKELAKHPELALDYIIAPPRMGHYLATSAEIYRTYLEFIAPEDIYAYSIDEIFCDLSSYLKMYQMSAAKLVTKIISTVHQKTHITATAGIGTNMYLAKVAMDILAKHAKPNSAGVRMAELDEISYREKLWTHQPITDFWRVGPGYTKRLSQNFMYTMGDVARCSLTNIELLYKLFGVNAELLIDHAWGYEPTTIADVKQYHPSTKSLSSGQVLQSPYTFAKARTIVKEMSDSLVLDMTSKNFVTNQLVLHIGYDVENLQNPKLRQAYHGPVKYNQHHQLVPKSAHGTQRLAFLTASNQLIREGFLELFDKYVNPIFTIRRLNLCVGNLQNANATSSSSPRLQQLDLFNYYRQIEAQVRTSQTDQKIQAALLEIRKRYGKNAILKGSNFEQGATTIMRNQQIGGHRA